MQSAFNDYISSSNVFFIFQTWPQILTPTIHNLSAVISFSKQYPEFTDWLLTNQIFGNLVCNITKLAKNVPEKYLHLGCIAKFSDSQQNLGTESQQVRVNQRGKSYGSGQRGMAAHDIHILWVNRKSREEQRSFLSNLYFGIPAIAYHHDYISMLSFFFSHGYFSMSRRASGKSGKGPWISNLVSLFVLKVSSWSWLTQTNLQSDKKNHPLHTQGLGRGGPLSFHWNLTKIHIFGVKIGAALRFLGSF